MLASVDADDYKCCNEVNLPKKVLAGGSVCVSDEVLAPKAAQSK